MMRLALACALLACGQASRKRRSLLPRAATGKTPQPHIHQVHTRPWLYSLAQSGLPANCSNGRGTQYVCLRDVPDAEWLRMKEEHADMIYLLGLWELGPESLGEAMALFEDMKGWYGVPDLVPEDIIGSPFAVVDYRLSPEIGEDQDLDFAVEKIRSLGMGVIVDFVPNHFARDSKLFLEHPEAFVQRPNGDNSPENWWYHKNGVTAAFGRGPYDGPWTDTLQVNYFSPRAVELLTDLVVSVAKRVDGIRLDMAHLILNEVFQRSWDQQMRAGGFSRPQREFWEQLISNVKSQRPDVIFVSEAYDYYFTQPPEQELLTNLGIDYSYNKKVLDLLEHFNLDNLKGYLSSESQGHLSRMCHFVENHDEPRAAFSLGGVQQSFAGAVVALTIPGARFTFQGQYEGLKNRLGIHLRRAMPEQPDHDLRAKYAKLTEILAAPLFHKGTWTYINVPSEGSGWRLMAWRWEYYGEKRLIVVNFSDQQGWGNVQVADAHASSGDEVRLTELLSGEEYTRSGSEMRGRGLTVGLPPWSAQIFKY